MEYRGYDSAGVALLDGDGGLTVAPPRRSAGQPRGGARRDRRGEPRRRHRPRPHPLGDTRSANRSQRASTRRRLRQDRRYPQRHHRELRRRSERSSNPQVSNCQRYRHRGRRPPAVAWPTTTAPPQATSPPSMAAVCRDCGAIHPGRGARRPAGHDGGRPPHSPLVVGIGDGEMFVGCDVSAFIEHTRDAIELGQDQCRRDHRDGYDIDFVRRSRRRTSSASTSTGT